MCAAKLMVEWSPLPVVASELQIIRRSFLDQNNDQCRFNTALVHFQDKMKSKSLLASLVLTNIALVLVILFLVGERVHPRISPSQHEFPHHIASQTAPANPANPEASPIEISATFPNQIDAIRAEEPPPAAMPAAIAPINESLLNPTEQQVAEWEAIQEDFINKVGNKLPRNPEEWQRWNEAREESDRILRIKFGEEIFQKQLQSAARENQVAFQ